MRFWDVAARIRDSKRWTAALMVANLAGIIGGYYYYYQVGQFDPQSPFYRRPGWWPFLSDSPNAVVLMSVALIGWHFGLRSRILDGLAFVHMAYVGLWTTYLYLLYPEQLGTFAWDRVAEGFTNPVLFVTHMGMPLEALLLVPHLRSRPWSWPLAGGITVWSGLNRYLDYAGPRLPPGPAHRRGP